MKKILIGVVCIFAVILMVVFGLRLLGGEDTWICQGGEWVKHGNPSAPKPTELCGAKEKIKEEVQGINIASPKSNETVSSPLKITGQVNGDGWIAFEGQAGLVKLQDSDGKEVASGILKSTTDWMTLPVDFEANLEFERPETETGWLVFSNENPSGLPEKNKEFRSAVKFAQETMEIKAYFNNDKLDPEFSCNKIFPIERTIPKTPAVGRAALEELLKGPTDKEKEDGYFTSISPGVKIQSLTIENEVAKVDFDETLEFQVGGSCRVSAIRAQITQTLKQFPTVKDVIISINGRTEDILQP